MCKVAGVSKVTDKNREDVWLFMMYLGDLMSKNNNDGLGYAAFDKKGNIFGEKWLINKTAFTDLSQYKNLSTDKKRTLYSAFGQEIKRDETIAIALHTRMATCEYGIKNTHPFVNDIDDIQTAIIHNGVISNHHELIKKYSTCDSEVIVHLLDEHKVHKNFNKIKDVMSNLFGWYTVISLTKNNEKLYMDLFTDSPRLSSYYIPELETRIYSTSARDIEDTSIALGMTFNQREDLKANTAHRIDVITGEVIDKVRGRQFDFSQYEKRNSNIHRIEGNFDDIHFFESFFGTRYRGD